MAWLLAAVALFQAAHVTDVAETADGFICRAQALPELRLSHDWRDGDRSAGLSFAAREQGASSLRFNFAFSPAEELPFGTYAAALGFQLDLAQPLRAPATAAHLRVDTRPDAVALLVEQAAPASITVAVSERQRGDLAQRLMRASIVELDLVDASGGPLGRYSWDVRKLRRAPELLQLVNWSCR